MLAHILAIDIGSAQIKTLMAQYVDDKLELTGVGIAKSAGIKKGTITDIEQAANSIRQSVADAKRQSGVNISVAVISISGTHVKSVESLGKVSVPTKEITEMEVNRALQTAIHFASISPDLEILHVLPYAFKVDGQDFIQDPVGMSGAMLEVKTNIIIVQKTTLENLRRTLEAAGIEIKNIVFSGYASTIAVIDDDAKELGVCVVDMGGGTCDLAIHQGNSIRYCGHLGVGGSHVTSDLSDFLHTSLEVGEKVKLENIFVSQTENKTIQVPRNGQDGSLQEYSLSSIFYVVYARIQETLMKLNAIISESNLRDQLGAGVVLTGGATKIDGLRDFASPLLENMNVRLAKPKIDGAFNAIQDPSFSTVFGLIKYATSTYTLYEIDSSKKLRVRVKKAIDHLDAKEELLLDPVIERQKKIKEMSAMSDIDLSSKKKENGVKAFFKKAWRNAMELF